MTTRRGLLLGLGATAGLVVARPSLAARLPALAPPSPDGLLATLAPLRELGRTPTRARAVADRLPRPDRIVVDGLVARPTTWTVDALAAAFPPTRQALPHRAVEGWSAVFPWDAVPLAAVLQAAGPLPTATHVRLVAHDRRGPDAEPDLPWPYHEGLTLPEALDAWLAVGLEGARLSTAEGAPARVLVPWKHAHKSLAAVARIELVAARPPSFWASVLPHELDWTGDVDPDRPHPRWRQDVEVRLPEGRLVPTRPGNGWSRG